MVRKFAIYSIFMVLCLVISGFFASDSDAFTKRHKIAYQSMVGEEFQIFMADLDKPDSPTQITRGEHGSKHPTLLSNGKRIYYYHWTPTNWGDMDLIYYQDLADNREWMVQRNSVHEENDPCISRDGSTLAYVSHQAVRSDTGTQPGTENWEVLCLRTDFSEVSRITQTKNDEVDPALNNNGDVVYFAVTVEKKVPDTEEEDEEKVSYLNFMQQVNESILCSAILSGSQSKDEIRTLITLYPGMGSGGGATKTEKLDDKKESDEEDEEDEEEEETYNFYYIFRNTFAGDDLERMTERDYSAWHPSVDANERWMVFASDMDGDEEIYIMDLENREIKRLTESEGYDGNPQISSDGEVIVFVSDRDGDKEIYSMNKYGRDVMQLTDNEIEDDNPAIT